MVGEGFSCNRIYLSLLVRKFNQAQSLARLIAEDGTGFLLDNEKGKGRRLATCDRGASD